MFKSGHTYSILVVVLVLVSNVASSAGFDYTRAMIHLNNSSQHDSIGFNLVKELPKLIYSRIKTGEVNLWDSPHKNVKINKLVLMDLERSSNTKFVDQQNIFINEYWKLFKKEFTFEIVGFTFYNTQKDGQDVIYGFLDIMDVMKLLKGNIIPTNANGEMKLTYWQALTSKRYNFNLVQFGNENFSKNPEESLKLIDRLFHNPKIKTNQYRFSGKKEIVYEIINIENDAYDNQLIMSKLSSFMNKNKQIFFNNGGDVIYSHLNKLVKLDITKIQVSETWQKVNGVISYQINWIDIYVDGNPLKRIRQNEIDQLDFDIKFTPFQNFILNKSFLYTIQSVNNQKISNGNSNAVISALLKNPWNETTQVLNQ